MSSYSNMMGAPSLLSISLASFAHLGRGVVTFAVYLVYTELFTIHAICLWCTSAHIMAFLLFAVILFGESFARPLTLDR